MQSFAAKLFAARGKLLAAGVITPDLDVALFSEEARAKADAAERARLAAEAEQREIRASARVESDERAVADERRRQIAEARRRASQQAPADPPAPAIQYLDHAAFAAKCVEIGRGLAASHLLDGLRGRNLRREILAVVHAAGFRLAQTDEEAAVEAAA